MMTRTLTLAAVSASVVAFGATAVHAQDTNGPTPPQAPSYNMPAPPAMPAYPSMSGYPGMMPRGDIAQRLQERRAQMMERRGDMQAPTRERGAPAAPPMPMDPMGKAMVEQMDQGRPEPIEDSSDIREQLQERRQEMLSRQGGGVHPAVQAKRDYYRARQQAYRNWFYGNSPMGGPRHGMMGPRGGAPYGMPMAPQPYGQQGSGNAGSSGE